MRHGTEITFTQNVFRQVVLQIDGQQLFERRQYLEGGGSWHTPVIGGQCFALWLQPGTLPWCHAGETQAVGLQPAHTEFGEQFAPALAGGFRQVWHWQSEG